MTPLTTRETVAPTAISTSRERGVTARVVLLSLLIAAAFAYLIPVIDYKFFNTFLGATHLPPGAVGALLVLIVVVNPILRILSKRLELERNEVLTVYLTCLFSTLTVGIGGNNYFVSFIIGSFYYATRENKWFDALKGLPPWFTPALNADGTYNRVLVESWYTGLSAGQGVPWGRVAGAFMRVGPVFRGGVLDDGVPERDAARAVGRQRSFVVSALAIAARNDARFGKIEPGPNAAPPGNRLVLGQRFDVGRLRHRRLYSGAQRAASLFQRRARVSAQFADRPAFDRGAVESDHLAAAANLSDCRRHFLLADGGSRVFAVGVFPAVSVAIRRCRAARIPAVIVALSAAIGRAHLHRLSGSRRVSGLRRR